MTAPQFLFEPSRALEVLVSQGVKYVVIGGVAAGIHGSSLTTFDIDICYERSDTNLRALAAALQEMDALPRNWPVGVPFVLDHRTLRNGDSFTFTTSLGDFDILSVPTGSGGYADLVTDALLVELKPGLTCQVASIEALIRMKRSAGRPKDKLGIMHLEAIRDELRKL